MINVRCVWGNSSVLMAKSLLAGVSLLLSACVGSEGGSHDSAMPDVPAADLVFLNGKVYTVNEQQAWAEAVAVEDGKITYVGSSATAEAYIDGTTEVVDLEGQLLLPGFQDAHVHPMEGASISSFTGCDIKGLADSDDNPENWIPALKACNDIPMPHDWVLGNGHDHSQLLGLSRLPKELLDEAFPDKPAAIMEKSSHSMWVNSKALEVVGITRDTPHPQGGKIGKDPITGEPSGVLYDSAGDELMHKALAKTPALQDARYDAILWSQDYMAEHGITAAVNARLYWTRGNLEPWLQAEADGELKVRNVMALWTYPHMDDDYQLAQLKSMYQNDKESLLRVSKIKFYSDGVPDLNSAAVLKPYGYLVHDQADPTGGNYFTGERMAKYLTALEPMGFSAIIHAIGDRGAREALDAIEAANNANPALANNKRHHYVSHVAWVSDQDIPRFAELNVPTDSQMNYIDFEDYEVEDDAYAAQVGDIWSEITKNNESNMYALPEIYKTGARMTISSDWDVANIDPLFSIQNAVQEFKGAMSESEIVEFAVKAYTLNAAYVMRQEDSTGSIEVGKYADMIVLDQNIFEIPVINIRDTKVMQTFLAGEEVYRASY